MDTTIKKTWEELREAQRKKRSAQRDLRVERSASQELCNHFGGMQKELREYKADKTGNVKHDKYEELEMKV